MAVWVIDGAEGHPDLEFDELVVGGGAVGGLDGEDHVLREGIGVGLYGAEAGGEDVAGEDGGAGGVGFVGGYGFVFGG